MGKKRCPACKEYNKDEDALNINGRFYCDMDCALSYANKNKLKAKKKIDAERKREDKVKLEKLKTAGDYNKEAQAAFNKYIRLRDSSEPCISCGSTPKDINNAVRGGVFDAGHYRSRGSASHLRFNLMNVHKQCVYCNRNLSGNIVEYRKGLIEKIGVERVELLENDNKPRKFTIEYLKRLKKIFNKRARYYEKRR